MRPANIAARAPELDESVTDLFALQAPHCTLALCATLSLLSHSPPPLSLVVTTDGLTAPGNEVEDWAQEMLTAWSSMNWSRVLHWRPEGGKDSSSVALA